MLKNLAESGLLCNIHGGARARDGATINDAGQPLSL
jgi:hypothetical protein